jgi:hypothetical protein
VSLRALSSPVVVMPPVAMAAVIRSAVIGVRSRPIVAVVAGTVIVARPIVSIVWIGSGSDRASGKGAGSQAER